MHGKIHRDGSFKVRVFGAQLSGLQGFWVTLLLWMHFYLYQLMRSVISAVKEAIPIQKVSLKLGRDWKAVKSSSICLSPINDTHIKAVVQEQIWKVEFFAECNSLHLLTFFSFRLSVVLRCLAFRMICNVNYIIVLSHILTSNGMIDYRIWAVYRWGSIIIWIITLPHKNSMAMECDIFLSLCISMKSGWYIKGYHLGNIFS